MILNSPYITGSLTVTGDIVAQGGISISGSIESASYSANSDKLDNLDSTSFVYTSSYNLDSSSFSTRVVELESTASILTTASASFAIVSSSFSTTSQSMAGRISIVETSYATTGSNSFVGSQQITGSLTISCTIIAQALNVQQVTSSIVYSCGSNQFGCALSDVQQFTGSVSITGSLSVNGTSAVTGTGTTNTVPKFTGASTIGNSLISATSTIVTIESAAANYSQLQLNGAAGYGAELKFGEATCGYLAAIRHNYNVGTGLEFYTGGLAAGNLALYINPSGNISIGNTNNTYKLDVSGTGRFSGTSGAFIGITIDNTDSTGSSRLRATSTGGNINDVSSFSASHPSRANQAWLGGDGSSTTTVLQAGGVEFLRGASTGAATFSSSVTASNSISVTAASTSFAPQFVMGQTGGNTYSAIGINRADGTGIATGEGSALVLRSGDSTNFPIQFATANNVRMTITSGGNVGIGSASPGYRLQVDGPSGDWAAHIKGSTSSGNSYGLFIDAGTTSADLAFLVRNAGATTNFFTITGTGAATFSSSVTATQLNATTTTAGYAAILTNTNGASDSNGLLVRAGSTSTEYVVRFAPQSDASTFFTVKGNGNVGIGTTSPGQKLSLGSPLGISSDATAYGSNDQGSIMWSYEFTGIFPRHLDIIAAGSPDGTNGGGNIRFFTNPVTNGANSVERMRITSGGNVIIGGTGSSGEGTLTLRKDGGTPATISNESVSGNLILFSGNGSGTLGSITHNGSNVAYNTSSDYRLKQDLKEFNGLDVLLSIKTYDYQWKSNNSRMYGVIAHELQSILPYAVIGEKDGIEMQGVDYSKIVPVLVKAIQELKAEIDVLKSNK
jgi:hypothetical protein